ncbi:glycerol kinase GlpK [Mycobacterium sp. Root135]|uniref:glycerol kinase GlpK n=1 Tax=Mycobacterium sp. Root135 TaxID=1736457 RepID=UPI0009E8944D|nr:glycerol kinase GlpK [Mycobacterium sp. Root135]
MSNQRVVATIDLGTTSARCMVFDHGGRMLSIAQREQRQSFPQPGWVEQDAAELWRNVRRVVPEALKAAGLDTSNVVVLGIANQRETTVVWDRRTGVPVAPAITWQDTRTGPVVDQLEPHADDFRRIAGLDPASYFAAPRLRWLLDNVRRLDSRAHKGEVLFGTLESWLIWNLTGGPKGGIHVTDVTNASRTLLMDLHTLEWSPKLMAILDIPEAMMPRIVSNCEVYANCATVLPGVPIAAALGDQQAALFGQMCFEPSDAKCTYGTGAFLLMNVGTQIVESSNGLLSTVAYAAPGAEPMYALEGPIAVAGSLVQWFRDQLGVIDTAPQIETLARTVDDNGGCYIVPAFSGLLAPHWDSAARGIVVGLTSYITKGHLARAVLEATVWQTWEVVNAMMLESGVPLARLAVDGGMTSNHLMMQYNADVLNVPVVRPFVSETVSLGAAYSAGLAVGYWPDRAALRANRHIAAAWYPNMDARTRRREAAGWKSAVARALTPAEVGLRDDGS